MILFGYNHVTFTQGTPCYFTFIFRCSHEVHVGTNNLVVGDIRIFAHSDWIFTRIRFLVNVADGEVRNFREHGRLPRNQSQNGQSWLYMFNLPRHNNH